MKVNIEAQLLCIPKQQMRGIPYVLKNILRPLINRNQNEYSLSCFDYDGLRGNRQLLIDNLGYIFNGLKIYECNTVSYKDIMFSIDNGSRMPVNCFYDEYFQAGFRADIYYFPHIQWISQNTRGKVVATCHDIMPVLEKYKHYWPESVGKSFDANFAYVKANEEILIAADSLSTKNDIVNHYDIDPARIFFVPLGIDRSIFQKTCSKHLINKWVGEKKYILYLGALDYRKGITDIVKSFDYIAERDKEVNLVLAGRTTPRFENVLKGALEDSKYANRIIITGFVSDEEKLQLLSNAEIFLLPSEYEGFGLPILEAMACECPVITTHISSIPEVAGNAVRYTAVNDPMSLADNVLDLLYDFGERERLIQGGLKQCDFFTWERTAELLEKVFAY